MEFDLKVRETEESVPPATKVPFSAQEGVGRPLPSAMQQGQTDHISPAFPSSKKEEIGIGLQMDCGYLIGTRYLNPLPGPRSWFQISRLRSPMLSSRLRFRRRLRRPTRFRRTYVPIRKKTRQKRKRNRSVWWERYLIRI